MTAHPHPRAEPIGALALWRQRVREGVDGQDMARPSTWRFDARYWAACREQWGLEELRAGEPNIAASLFLDAANILVAAATAKLAEEGRAA